MWYTVQGNIGGIIGKGPIFRLADQAGLVRQRNQVRGQGATRLGVKAEPLSIVRHDDPAVGAAVIPIRRVGDGRASGSKLSIPRARQQRSGNASTP